jgi:small conductance mechanosensitive channel
MPDLTPETLKVYYDIAMPILTGVLIGIAILIAGWLVSKRVNRMVVAATDRAKLDAALGRFLGSMAQYTVLAATVIAALERVGVQTTSLVAVLASAGLAIGLALQGSLANFASGVMILFFRPFSLGDVIKAAGETGKVVDIGLFFTTMTTPDNQKIIVPNSSITGGVITNIAALGTRRANIDVGVAYGEDVEAIRALLLDLGASTEGVLEDPAPTVVFTEMAASSINFQVRVWTTPEDYWDVIDRVRSSAYTKLNEAGIEIPFNQIVVHQAVEDAAA